MLDNEKKDLLKEIKFLKKEKMALKEENIKLSDLCRNQYINDVNIQKNIGNANKCGKHFYGC